jgi:hypothetical protein
VAVGSDVALLRGADTLAKKFKSALDYYLGSSPGSAGVAVEV